MFRAMESDAAAPQRRAAWITLVVLDALQLLSLAPWLMMGALSFMAFDAPGSDRMWEPWAFVIAVWSYPLWLLIAGVVSWILFAKRRSGWAIALASVFTLPAVGMALVLLLAHLG